MFSTGICAGWIYIKNTIICIYHTRPTVAALWIKIVVSFVNEPLPKLPPRQPDAHKGDFGTALIIGGSRGMTGAAILAGMAALRGGAGLVRLAVADACLDTIASFEPSYMTAPLPSDATGKIALKAVEQIIELGKAASVLALGPGLGRSNELNQLVVRLYRGIEKPMVVDADALNALSAQPDVLDKPGGPRVLTPHPGEFARLVGKKLPEDQRQQAAVDLAARCGVVVLLKGHRTLITDGRRQAINATGNPGMATGGSGDSLTGLITALICQHLEPFAAAQLGAYLHGLAGDLAAKQKGEVSLIARDLVEFLPAAFQEYAGRA
jgi:ADP-dependent NAD(P)H-hydrate dehydratase